MTSCNPIDVLLVEDNPGDVDLTKVAFRRAKIANRLSVAKDGVEALAFLRQEGPYSASPRPYLILLDLNLPKKNGREVLTEIKDDLHLRRIPVIVLTSSQAERDVVESYSLHANGYIVKPVDFDQLVRVVRSLEDFWFTMVRLPHST
jgi:CheY-like chemotaxis protein